MILIIIIIIILGLIITCASVELIKTRHSPIDSYSNENFPLFPLPGAANPRKGRRHIRNRTTPACKI